MSDAAIGIADALNDLARDPSSAHWQRVVVVAWPLITTACYRITRERGDDAVQETLLHIRAGARGFRTRGTQDPDGEACRWLRRVATTSALALLRSDRRTRFHSTHAKFPPLTDHIAPLTDELALMHEELVALNEPDRTAIALHHLQGQDLEAVAQALDCTPEAARKRIARALATLRTRLIGRGVALGAIAITTALRDAPAATVPISPTATALHLLSSPLKPITSITNGSGVVIMATSLAGAAAILTTALVWNPVTGADPTPNPTTPPLALPSIATVPPLEVHWLDLTMPRQQNTTENLHLGRIPDIIADVTGHPVFCKMDWFASGRRQADDFPVLAGQTPRAALDQLAKTLDAAWLLVEGQILIATTGRIAELDTGLSQPMNPPDTAADAGSDIVDLISYLRSTTHLEFVVDPQVIGVEGLGVPAAINWSTPLPAVEVMGLLAKANGWSFSLRDSAVFVSPAPLVRPLMEPQITSVTIRGSPWTPAPLDQIVSLDVQEVGLAQVLQNLSITLRNPIPMAAAPDSGSWPITFKCREMRLRLVLDFLGKLSGTRVTEPEIGKQLLFVPLSK